MVIKALVLSALFFWLAIAVGMVALFLGAVWLVGTIVMAIYEGVQEGRRAH